MARLIYALNARRRAIIKENLVPVVGTQNADTLGSRLLENFAMTEVDFFCPPRRLVENMHEENFSVLEEARRRFKKVVAVTAHIGNWELGMSYLVSKGYPMAGVYALYREEKVVRWIMSHRDPHVEWIPAARGAFANCLETLERGRMLAMVADIPFGERGRRVNLCGARTHLPLGPWAIASRARAAVVPAFILREKPGQYVIRFQDPILPQEGSFRKQIEQMQDVYLLQLEKYIKTYPEQWGVLQPFWEPV